MRRRGRYAGVQFQFSQTEAGTSSSAQQPEASSAAQHSEPCPSSSAQHDPPVHQSDDEIHVQDGSGRVRPRRGPTVVRDVWQMREGERIVVECNQLGQPIKKAACLLISFLGTVARRPQLCPLGYAKWNDMLPTYKVELLRVIESKFVLPPSTHDFVMKSLNRKWKEYRAQLKKDYMRQGMTEEEVARNCPPDVPPHQWMELVHYWFSERTYSAIGRAARAAQSVPHISGSKSYARLRQEFVDEHGREPGQVEFYRMTHTHQDGTFVRDESRDLYERATSLIVERDDESAASTQQSRIEAEVFTELLGPECYGRVRDYGVGVTPTQLSEVSRYTQHAAADAQDSRVRRLEAEIQEIRQSRAAEMEEMRQSRAEMQAMRGQIDRLTSLLEMYGPSQAPGTSGTRRDSGTSRGDNDDHPPAD
ncbi:uncharacterized protein [Elaeis guineensis]|uniref:uncharacterized protein n=1 Tax=Elaeis guineensis var. tenera TaxID=51953 RepID=UPI003C6CDB02